MYIVLFGEIESHSVAKYNSLICLSRIGLIQIKEAGWTGFYEGWQGCSEENPKEQPCQPEENPVFPDSFTWIYILFKIGHFGDISDFFQILMFEEA